MLSIQETLDLKKLVRIVKNAIEKNKQLPFSCANVAASKVETSRSAFRSLLFPTKMITILGEAKLLASLNQLFKALNDSRLQLVNMLE